MVRLAVFPLVFGGALVLLTVGFYNRRKLFPEVEEIQRRKARESHSQAQEFRASVAEGLRKEREKKSSN